jgi:hypothetical protein
MLAPCQIASEFSPLQRTFSSEGPKKYIKNGSPTFSSEGPKKYLKNGSPTF